MSEKLGQRTLRTSDELWAKIQLAANDTGVSASAYVAGVLERSLGGAERPRELPGATGSSVDPPGPVGVAPAPVLLPWRPAAGEVPVALERPDTCPHPAASRFRGAGFGEHCRACGQAFGRTRFGWGEVVPAEEL
jgi:hypothetical protein